MYIIDIIIVLFYINTIMSCPSFNFQNIVQTAYGLSKLTEMFHLCKPLKSIDDVSTLKGWIVSALVYLAMVDYPYPSKFLAPLPAWPVKVCSPLILFKHFNTCNIKLYTSISNTSISSIC